MIGYNFYCFSVPIYGHFRQYNIRIMHGCGPSNEMCRQLQQKKTEVSNTVLAILCAIHH